MTEAPFILAYSLSPEEEADLISRIKAGDQAACAELVARFTPRMMAVARRFLCCDDDCNDALQDAYISVFRALPGFEGNSRLSTWLHRITVNSCLMRLRSGASRNEASLDDLLPAIGVQGCRSRKTAYDCSPSSELEAEEAREVVRQAIGKLPDHYRKVLMLRDIEEMDTADTAAHLNITQHNVKRRLHHVRQALYALLAPALANVIVALA